MANLVTLSRILLLFVGVGFIYSHTFYGEVAALVIVLMVILMDWLDGYVARSRNAATPFGAMMDILGDRIVENTLWIVFAHLHLIPVWVPIVVMIRGFLTDSFRGFALSRGRTPFGEKTMVRGRIGRLIVSSRFSRALYAGAKVFAFCAMILYLVSHEAGNLYGEVWRGWEERIYEMALGLVYLTVFLCIVRAVPVIRSGMELVRADR